MLNEKEKQEFDKQVDELLITGKPQKVEPVWKKGYEDIFEAIF